MKKHFSSSFFDGKCFSLAIAVKSEKIWKMFSTNNKQGVN